MISLAQLQRIMPHASLDRCVLYCAPLNDAMTEFDIDTPIRQAAFLAQLAHESAELRYVRELATGEAYEHRAALGNTEPGDGVRYKGRGLIQITGRLNYAQCGDALGIGADILQHPELLEEPVNACRSAAWFWSSRHLNDLADQGDFLRITKRINGGTNGYGARLGYWELAKAALA